MCYNIRIMKKILIVFILLIVGAFIFWQFSNNETSKSPVGSRQVDSADTTGTATGSVKPAIRSERTVMVGGVERSYIMYTPRTISTSTPYDVIFAYHPALAQGSFMEENAPFYTTPGLESFVTVYPNGISRTFNAGECCGGALNRQVDDLAFFTAMLADIQKVVPIKDKVYLTGFSNGSLMTYRLICEFPNKIAAAVPFAAAQSMVDCTNGVVPVMHLNGREDELSLYGATDKEYPHFSNANVLVPPPVALSEIASRNGCSATRVPDEYIASLDATCEQYSGCPAAFDVLMCVIPDLGHAWPGSSDASGTTKLGGMGPYRPELDGTAAIAAFFLEHPVR